MASIPSGARPRSLARLAAFLAPLAAVACHVQPPVAPASANPPAAEATPIVITPHEDEPTPAEEFDRARELLLQGHAREAALRFDEIAAADSAQGLAPYASFNAGVGWEQVGDRDAALERFRSALKSHPDGDLGKWAALRSARLYADRDDWSHLSAMAEILLQRGDLDDLERLATYGAKALSLVQSGDAESADRFISKGRDIVEATHLGEGGKLPVEVAQLYFALGEARRLRSEAIVFVPLPDHFADALERRCQGLLDAQSAYSDAMRSYDPHWAAMSGYRVGALYQQLYKDVMAIPPPKAADTTDKKRLFEGAMRLRYRVLLEKGLTMMEHTLLLGLRTDDKSAWIDRARAAQRELNENLREQRELIAKLPYSEKDLRAALEDLAH